MRTRHLSIASTILFCVLLAMLMVVGNNTPTLAQGGPTSTLVPASPTPNGTPPPTFIPSAPQRPTVLAIGETVHGELLIGRWAIYEFRANAGQKLSIRLRSSDFDPLLEVYAPTDYSTPLFVDDDSGRGRNAALYAITVPSDGVYRVFARSYKNEGSGAYLLSVVDGAGSIPVDVEVRSIMFDALVTGELNAEQDYYAFDASAGDVVSVLLSSTAFDTYLEVVDSSGRILDDNDDNGRDKNSAVTNLTIPEDGTYYIIVASYMLYAEGEYLLELLRVNPALETAGNVLNFNSRHTARLLPDVTDQWTFVGTAGQRISLGAMPTNPASELDLILELGFPGEGREINDDGGFGRNPALTDFVLPEAGTYTVSLREFNATIGGDYHLLLYEGRQFFAPGAERSVHVLPNAQGRTAIIDTASTTDAPYALYSVTVPANQWLAARVVTGNGGAGLPQDFLITLLDTTYAEMAEPANGTLRVQNTGVTADFLLLLQYRGPGVQSYRLTLDLSATPPPLIELPIVGSLELAQPLRSDLPVGVRHARTFVAPAAGSYRVTLNKIDETQSYDPYLYVLNELGETIAEDDDSAGAFDPQIQLELETGEQIIVVAASFADATGGDYQLQIDQE